MRKIFVLMILIVALVVSGCLKSDFDIEEAGYPNDTVLTFVDSFKSNDLQTCYSLMSEDYKKKTDAHEFAELLDGYKNNEALDYEFIEVKDYSAVEDSAIVYIVYNETTHPFLSNEEKVETLDRKLELVGEDDAWRFDEFPIELI
jgi:hypothetical protein